MRVCQRASHRATTVHSCVLFVRASHGQISGAPLTQEVILGVLDTSGMCSFAWYSSQLANQSVLKSPYHPLSLVDSTVGFLPKA